MASADILTSLGLDLLIADEAFAHDAAGHLVDPAGTRVVLVNAAATRGFRRVLEAEEPGAWARAMKASGVTCGTRIATGLDTALARLGKPALAALPLEACLALLEHSVAAHGWGRLKIDLNDASHHGFVVARIDHSFNAEILADVVDFVDPLLAGTLQGFFTHISGQNLACEEIACARRGAPQCVFVITDAGRLATITPAIGRETTDQLLAQLRQ